MLSGYRSRALASTTGFLCCTSSRRQLLARLVGEPAQLDRVALRLVGFTGETVGACRHALGRSRKPPRLATSLLTRLGLLALVRRGRRTPRPLRLPARGGLARCGLARRRGRDDRQVVGEPEADGLEVALETTPTEQLPRLLVACHGLERERDAVVLAKLRDQRIRASEETIRKSLAGNWRSEHLFTLKQSRQMYQHYQEQIAACDREIEKLVVAFEPRVDPDQRPLPPDRKRKQSGRKTRAVNPKSGFSIRTESYKLFGVDLTQIPGLSTIILTLFSEVGREMSRWPTAAHFASWLALCPDNDISGGRVLWRGTRKVHNQAGQLFRLAAHSLHHNQTPIGDYLRRMKSKTGPAAATTATAHKIAIIFYTMVKNQEIGRAHV